MTFDIIDKILIELDFESKNSYIIKINNIPWHEFEIFKNIFIFKYKQFFGYAPIILKNSIKHKNDTVEFIVSDGELSYDIIKCSKVISKEEK